MESLVAKNEAQTPGVSRDILIVFDIDETLIQFINNNAYRYWLKFRSESSPEDIRRFDNMIEFTDYPGQETGKGQVILFRPGLKEFLEMAKQNPRIKVAIWTYSEQSYADRIAREICDKFGLEPDTFIFKYSSAHIDDDFPKSLEQIWSDPKFGSKFNKFNTFLVDDRYGNLCHETNEKNSILVQAFAPFGENKVREAMSSDLLTKAVDDHMFSDLTEISNKILEDIDGCDDAEINDAFKTESVFAPKCMKRRGLSDYVETYKMGVKLCTIGEVENADAVGKGGRRTKKRRNYKKTTQIKRGKMMKRGKSMRKNVKYMKSKRYHRR
jgi:hypothetical protein